VKSKRNCGVNRIKGKRYSVALMIRCLRKSLLYENCAISLSVRKHEDMQETFVQFLGAVGKQVVKIKMTLYTKNLQDVAVEGKTR